MRSNSQMYKIFDASLLGTIGEVDFFSTGILFPGERFPLCTALNRLPSRKEAAGVTFSLGGDEQREPLPVGTAIWESPSLQPTISFGFRDSGAALGLKALPSSSGAIITAGQLKLSGGEIEFAIAPGMERGPGQPFVTEIRFEPRGAFPYSVAQYDAGGGRQNLQVGTYHVETTGADLLRFWMEPGDCAQLELGWVIEQF